MTDLEIVLTIVGLLALYVGSIIIREEIRRNRQE